MCCQGDLLVSMPLDTITTQHTFSGSLQFVRTRLTYASASGWVSAPFVLVPSNSVFGRFDLAALRNYHT
jgi:hypothetical protein